MIKWIGSQYGGWHVDVDRIPYDGLILSAGLGNDITFDVDLVNEKDCRIIGLDPGRLSSKHVTTLCHNDRALGMRYTFVRKALCGTDDGIVIEDLWTNGNSMFGRRANKRVESISLDTLLAEYPDACLLKMNIEGGEYPALLESVKPICVPQLLIRFHHRKADVPYTLYDTTACMQKLCDAGYTLRYGSDANAADVDYEVVLTR